MGTISQFRDTPIEIAFLNGVKLAASQFGFKVLPFDTAYPHDRTVAAVYYTAQTQLLDWPVDFVFVALDQIRETAKLLIVECDGHKFHERTKEQAAKDRSRDRAIQECGWKIYRFTGSEIWNEPRKCGLAVLDWAYAARRGFQG